jgi:hypothetical protein
MTVTISKLTEGLGCTEAGIKVFEDIDSKEQQATATRRRIMRMLACCEEIMKETKRSLSRRISVPDSSSRLQVFVHRHLYLLDILDDDLIDPPKVQEEVPPP